MCGIVSHLVSISSQLLVVLHMKEGIQKGVQSEMASSKDEDVTTPWGLQGDSMHGNQADATTARQRSAAGPPHVFFYIRFRSVDCAAACPAPSAPP